MLLYYPLYQPIVSSPKDFSGWDQICLQCSHAHAFYFAHAISDLSSSPKGTITVPNTPNHLNRQLRRRRLVQHLLVLAQLLRHLALAVILDNLGAVADKQLGVDQAVDFVPDGLRENVSLPFFCPGAFFMGAHLEELGLLDPLEQVVAAALLLDDVAGLVGLICVSDWCSSYPGRRERTRTRISSWASWRDTPWVASFIRMDSVATWEMCQLQIQRESVRQSHTERKLLVDAGADDVGVDDQAVGDVVQRQEDGVGEQELRGVSMISQRKSKKKPTISGISMRRIAPAVVSTKTARRGGE